MLALWAWLTYGGLGARTRRGFGQLGCTGVRGELPCGWTQEHLAPPPTADDWHALGSDVYPSPLPGAAALGWAGPLPAPAPENEPLPQIPALAPRWWAGFVLDEPADSLGRALHLAGLRWRQFRAADADDRGDKPSQSTRSPEWRNVIHGTDSRYPIAAFGLPVGYFSHSGGRTFKATVDPKLGDEPLRRASPVWLRPVQVGPHAWDVFTHLFLAQLLPPDATLQVSGGTRRTLPPPADVEDAWNRWIDGAPRLPHDYYRRS
jgi:CRISPR-associated protein Cmr1